MRIRTVKSDAACTHAFYVGLSRSLLRERPRISRCEISRTKEHPPAASDEEAETATASRWLEWLRLYALDHVIASLWDGMLRACSAVEVFDFFHSAPLATVSYRHHCLLALRRKSCVRRISLRPSIA